MASVHLYISVVHLLFFRSFAVKITHVVFHKCSAHIFMGTRIVCGNENLRKKFLHWREKMLSPGTGEMAWQTGTLADLQEDLFQFLVSAQGSHYNSSS